VFALDLLGECEALEGWRGQKSSHCMRNILVRAPNVSRFVVTFIPIPNQFDMNRSLLTRLCTPPVSELKNFTPVPLRLIVGYGFIAHGYTKIAKGPGHFFLILNALGVPAPHIMGWATILI